MLRGILAVLFIQKYITAEEAEYLEDKLKEEPVPERIDEMAYAIDAKLGEYRIENPEAIKPRFGLLTLTGWFFNFMRSLNVSPPRTSREDTQE